MRRLSEAGEGWRGLATLRTMVAASDGRHTTRTEPRMHNNLRCGQPVIITTALQIECRQLVAGVMPPAANLTSCTSKRSPFALHAPCRSPHPNLGKRSAMTNRQPHSATSLPPCGRARAHSETQRNMALTHKGPVMSLHPVAAWQSQVAQG